MRQSTVDVPASFPHPRTHEAFFLGATAGECLAKSNFLSGSMSTLMNRINDVNLYSAKPLKTYFLFLGLGLIGMLCASAQTAPAISKPPAGSQINWKHPLAQGLVTAVPLNEGSGTKFYDAVTQQTYSARVLPGTPAGAQPPAWINPPVSQDYPWVGPAISNNNATAQSIQSTKLATEILDSSKVGVGYSYAALFQPLEVTALGRIFDTTKNAPMVMYMLNNRGQFGPRSISATWCDASHTAINPIYQYTMNKWVLVLCTVQDGLGVMYVNGVEVARNTHVNLHQSVADVTGQLVYNATGNGAMMFNANFSSFWGWSNRVLTAQEAAELYTDPWAMFDRSSATPQSSIVK
jgi:hypothetical protein